MIGEKGILYAWYDSEEDQFFHIYPRRFQVEMCSPDGFKKKTETGEGRIVTLKVKEENNGNINQARSNQGM